MTIRRDKNDIVCLNPLRSGLGFNLRNVVIKIKMPLFVSIPSDRVLVSMPMRACKWDQWWSQSLNPLRSGLGFNTNTQNTEISKEEAMGSQSPQIGSWFQFMIYGKLTQYFIARLNPLRSGLGFNFQIRRRKPPKSCLGSQSPQIGSWFQ